MICITFHFTIFFFLIIFNYIFKSIKKFFTIKFLTISVILLELKHKNYFLKGNKRIKMNQRKVKRFLKSSFLTRIWIVL